MHPNYVDFSMKMGKFMIETAAYAYSKTDVKKKTSRGMKNPQGFVCGLSSFFLFFGTTKG
jgi:hypothetical protein